MVVCNELREIDWPSEFVVEYADGTRERLLRGDGVHIIPPADDPDGGGGLCADLPKKHPRNQEQGGRYVCFTELRAIYSAGGRRLWAEA